MTFPLDSRQMIGVGGVRVMAHAPHWFQEGCKHDIADA